MAEILMFAVNHNDPCGRKLIYRTLLKKNREGFIPDCVAVEWNSVFANRVIEQRNELYTKLRDAYPNSKSGDLHLFADAVAYEADSHMVIYPDLPILWLDEKRDIQQSDIDSYADERLSVYKCHAIATKGCLDLLGTRDRLLNIADCTPKPTYRDAIFFDEIQCTIRTDHQKIICVVGSNHANTQIDGMFGNLLIKAGYTVTVIDITRMTEV